MKCSSCGANVKMGGKFCTICGAKIDEQMSGDKKNRGVEITLSRKCANCGAKVKKDSKFCTSCGTVLEGQIVVKSIDLSVVWGKVCDSIKKCAKTVAGKLKITVRKCANCGAKVKKDSKFCTSCGTSLEGQIIVKSVDLSLIKDKVCQTKSDTSKTGNNKLFLKIGIAVIAVVVVIVAVTVGNSMAEKKQRQDIRLTENALEDAGVTIKENNAINVYYNYICVASFTFEDLGIDFSKRTQIDIPSGKVLIQTDVDNYRVNDDKYAVRAISEFASAHSNEVVNGTGEFRIGFRDPEHVSVEWLKKEDLQKAIDAAKKSLDEGYGYASTGGTFLMSSISNSGNEALSEKRVSEYVDRMVKADDEFAATDLGEYEWEWDYDIKERIESYRYGLWRIEFPESKVYGMIVDPMSRWIEVSGKNSVDNTITVYYELISDNPILLYEHPTASGVRWLDSGDISSNDTINNSTIGEVKYK